ncbi:alpha/beta-hydrolase [Colletotrichum zoysiae]|uniref:Alpha/beta-hydrolase n=1 Tax=Colletotrichum zoysiae TaxID=1216348 RepID=A0AAD9H3Y2_9PEZI|nr:alpha/beta-hydrolase [Colletotrichum zoysiae]
MIDHVLGRPSVKSRRLQVLAVLAFWSAYLFRGPSHGPPVLRFLSKLTTKRLTAWQTVVITMIYLYAARHFSTLVGLASPEPMANMYDATYFRATWILTALDAGFWTAMKIRAKWLRDLASIVFSVFYMVAAEKADEKVRKVRGMLTVEHLRVSWDKGTTPYLSFFQNLMRPRFSRWPPRAIRIPRPAGSDYKEPVSAWLYLDGPLTDLAHHNRIVLDIPGGGFVAMDPRCNDDKLFAWASKTGLPVLSLDYKKAPEFPYPYALNECFDVYTTLIRSKGRCIGMSGRETPKIVITGDSAGGNLATATTLMIVERTSVPMRRYSSTGDLPLPDGLVLFYPALDMNIGNWMSDDQMSLMKDRRLRSTNQPIIRRKSMQYNDLVGTPHHSDDEEDSSTKQSTELTIKEAEIASQMALASPHPEYSHGGPQGPSPNMQFLTADAKRKQSTSHHSEPLRTRLAMSSMISYFNDRVLTPEMMRAMIILYIGPHNRPDFSKDYLLSPVLTPDSLLARFPKVYFLTGERDPLVDDTVIFSARLRKVKEAMFDQARSERSDHGDGVESVFNPKDVAEVMLIPGISHGFMQFPTVYPPAWKHFERSAEWITEIFASADAVREREGRGRRRAAGGHLTNGNTEGRHHLRAESSGDEDRPLEISMTRANRKNTLTKEPQAMDESESIVDKGEGGGKKRNGRARGASKSSGASLVKLKSTDDLLGRRMQGLAGGLTGVGGHE